MNISRGLLDGRIQTALKRNPIVSLIGPRQCGKTTLARIYAMASATYFDLEKPTDARRMENPMTALESIKGLIIIDEAQMQPALFPILRVLADRTPNPAKFLILGSASPDLVKGVSESLAGRVGLIDMGGFDLEEIGSNHWKKLWLRGGFPRSYLAEDDASSFAWRQDFIKTFLERDMRQYGMQIPTTAHSGGRPCGSMRNGRRTATRYR